jgi:hypothetical protein
MSSDSQGQLRSRREEKKVMNNRKSQKSRPSPELANEIVSTTLEKNRWAEQIKYLARLKTKLLEFAKGMCATRDRGAVSVGWPWPASLDVIPRNVFYLTESFLRSQGMTPDHTTLQAIERYDPNMQAVVLLADEIGVAYTHVIDSTRRVNGIARMKEQFGYSDGMELWRERMAKKDE